MRPPNAPEPSLPGRRARLFRNGRNQAVRTLREFEIAADSVTIYREDDRLVIEPVERTPALAEVLSGLVPLDVDFGPIDLEFVSRRYRGDWGTMTFDTSVRPRFLLFNVDVGWSTRR